MGIAGTNRCGMVNWRRVEGSPDENLHLYSDGASIGAPLDIRCVDYQFWHDPNTTSPFALFAHSIATSHMFAFIELCGQRSCSLSSYIDEPITLSTLRSDELSLDKIVLMPKAHFEGSNVPELPAVESLHGEASQMATLEKLVASVVEVRLI